MGNRFSWHRCRGALAGIGFALFLATVLSIPAEAQEKQPPDQCTDAVSPTWTRQEAWVWKQLCLRKDADLNESRRFGATTDVDDATSWSPKRILRPSFVESILIDTDYSDKLANRPITIEGAWFRGPINLDDSSIPFSLYLKGSRFDAEVSAVGADIGGTIGFSGSTFKDKLDLTGAKVDGHVFLNGGAKFQGVDLLGANIGENVEATGSTFKDKLNLNVAKVEGDVFLNGGAEFQGDDFGAGDGVNLVGAYIGENVQANGSTFKDKLDLNGAKVERHVFLNGGAKFQGVDLGSSNIGSNVVANGSTFKDELDLNGAKIGAYVFLNNGEFQAVHLDRANIDGDVNATESSFKGDLSLNAAQVKGSVFLRKSNFKTGTTLAGATIGGVLSLSYQQQHPIWDESARMDLEGTTVRVIDDAPEAWPRHLRLAGFMIQQTHGQGVPLRQGFTGRPISWYLDWLGRQGKGTFTREPYILIENLLRTVGRNRDADRIAMERMDHEYTLGGIVHHTVGLVWSSTVGYGYRPERAIFWIVGLVLIGWLILIAWGIADQRVLMPISWLMLFGWGAADDHVLMSDLKKNGVTSRLMLSAQRLIPLITFGKGYEDVDLTSKAVPPWVRWYFYVHAILGYILAAFLLTALAKITTT